jgi:hypothetical protein
MKRALRTARLWTVYAFLWPLALVCALWWPLHGVEMWVERRLERLKRLT